RDMRISLETSGTLPLQERLGADLIDAMWITISPKHPYMDGNTLWANEFKLLVDEDFDMGKVPQSIRDVDYVPVFIQPVNFENEINGENVKRVMKLQEKY